MRIDDAISQLRKKRLEASKVKQVNPTEGFFNKLNNNLIGAMADIAQVFADKTGKTEIVGRPRVEVTNFPKLKTTPVDLTPVVKAIKAIPSVKPTDMSVVVKALRAMPIPSDIDLTPLIQAIREIPKAEKPSEEVKVKNQIALDKVESMLSQLVKASQTASGIKDDTLLIKELRSLFSGLSEAVQESRTDSVRVINPGDFPVSPAKTAYKKADGEVSDGLVDDDHHVQVDVLTMPDVTLNAGDIEVGAVEIKDGATDTRATVDADGLHVSVQQSVLPTGASTLAEQQTQSASLSVLDDWDESDRAKVNPIVGEAGVEAGSGVDTTKTQRVSLATDVGLPEGYLHIGEISHNNDDIFGNQVFGLRDNQIQVNFFSDDPGNLVTVTTTGSGGATRSGGEALFSTGTTASSSVKGVSLNSIRYLGQEVYGMFTASFTSPTADSNQRIGLFSTTGTTNGFFIGYEGTSFGITHRNNSVDTTTPQASFNVDTLTGSAASRFRSGGVPVVLDTTKNNVYRIRFGWLGSAPIIFEILSPDDEWVIFHVIRYPNTANTPSLTTPNLPATVQVTKTSGAEDIIIRTACWVFGTTSDLERLDTVLTDATLTSKTKSVIAGKNPAGDYVNFTSTTSGNFKVSLEEFENAVSVNSNTQLRTTLFKSDGVELNLDATGDVQVDIKTIPTVTVTATDLDIRDLTSVSDSVSAVQSGAWDINDITGTVSLPTGASTLVEQQSQTSLLTTIDADTSTIAGAVSGNEVQVDVVTMPTVSVEPDGTDLSNGQVTVDTTVGGVVVVAASAGRQGVSITNQGSVGCYIGTGTVSAINGFYLGPGESLALPTDSDIKGITSSSSTTVGFLAYA